MNVLEFILLRTEFCHQVDDGEIDVDDLVEAEEILRCDVVANDDCDDSEWERAKQEQDAKDRERGYRIMGTLVEGRLVHRRYNLDGSERGSPSPI